MLTSPRPATSTFERSSPVGPARQPKRPLGTLDGVTVSATEKQPLWIPMLQAASKGKDLSEKQLILLGGTADLQQEFLEQLNPDVSSRKNIRSNDRRRQKQSVPISNKFALGYTYHDVLDADQEDILARLNIYMLANPSGQLSELLQPLLSAKTVKDSLITILLDWNDPFSWARRLRQWIRLLRNVILHLDEETKLVMEENMTAWREKRLGPDAQQSTQQEGIAPPGPGEWDEGLGIPISVVCVRSEKIERLERELGWGDDQFDFLQQWLRTVLLKHGGSLVYTASFEPNNVRTLLHTSLNIQSLLKRETAKHNIIDRDKILVPPNWDSWGKIRILREGFDSEAISSAWSVEIQQPPENEADLLSKTTDHDQSKSESPPTTSTSAVTIFETSLPNPISPSTTTKSTTTPDPITTATPFQDFLHAQSTILDKLKIEDAAELDRLTAQRTSRLQAIEAADPNTAASRAMSPVKTAAAATFLADSIGSHRVNVNGIDFDADEATRRLRERETSLRRAASETVVTGSMSGGPATGAVSPAKQGIARGGEAPLTPGGSASDGRPSNEQLKGFFANLITKDHGRNRGSNAASGNGSPRRESPAPGLRREE